MHRITLLLIIALLIPDLYIYLIYIVRRTKRRLFRLAYWAPTILLVAAYIYFVYLTGGNALAHHTQGIGRLAIAILLFAAPKTAFMLCSLVGVVVHLLVRCCPRWPFTAFGVAVSLVCFANIAYGAFWGISHFEVKEVEYRSDKLPDGFDGYRIVQISDLHIGSWQGDPATVERMVELVNRQGADREYLHGRQDIHEASLTLQQRVREVYLAQTAYDDQFRIVSCVGSDGGMLPPETIFTRIEAEVKPLLPVR